MGVVRSVAVLADPASAAVDISSPAGVDRKNTRTFSDDDRRLPGIVTATADEGVLDRCFLDIDATTRPDADLTIYDKASESIIGFVVGGPGATENPALSVGPDYVSVNATVGDQPRCLRRGTP